MKAYSCAKMTHLSKFGFTFSRSASACFFVTCNITRSSFPSGTMDASAILSSSILVSRTWGPSRSHLIAPLLSRSRVPKPRSTVTLSSRRSASSLTTPPKRSKRQWLQPHRAEPSSRRRRHRRRRAGSSLMWTSVALTVSLTVRSNLRFNCRNGSRRDVTSL